VPVEKVQLRVPPTFFKLTTPLFINLIYPLIAKMAKKLHIRSPKCRK